MTTPARQAEADRVEDAFNWAVSTLGNAAAAEAKEVWTDHIPPSVAAAQRAQRAFVAALILAIFTRRKQAEELAIAYYRLVRALRIGSTVSVGIEEQGATVSLETLRADFDAALDEVERVTTGVPVFTTGDPDNDFVDPQPDVEYVQDDEAIEVDQVIDLDPILDANDETAEEQLREAAENLGTRNFQKKATRATRRAREDAEPDIEGARDSAGNRQAAAAMRVMMNAARGLVYDLGSVDQKIQGWVRYSTTGSPCGFCGMLIAREDIYRTRATAQHQGNNQTENKYHDNCKCTTIPIFDLEQFLASDLSAQHKEYASLWKIHINGKYSGVDALNAFRTLLRKRDGATTIAPPLEEAA